MNPPAPILIVDDEEALVDAYRVTLTRNGVTNLICCTDSRKALEIIETQELEAAILDLTMPYVSGEELLERIVLRQPDAPVLVVTGKNDADSAVKCMKLGAHDYLTKPVPCERIRASVGVLLNVRALQRETQSLRSSLIAAELKCPDDFSEIVTVNETMKSTLMYIGAVSNTPHPILLSGETGVGKELFARAIHRSSKRQGKLVSVNIAGLDDNVFTDTLFGHKKGAYTGADESRPGLIAAAAGGTLFLDEIGDLSQFSQVKLLRLLQEKEYLPLGQDLPVKTDARVVVATNVDLQMKMDEGAFRPDLFYRLNTHRIRIPPLRERLDDLPYLLNHFLESAANVIGRKKPTPPKELLSILSGYDYPGNVRELEAMITDAVSLHTSHVLSTNSFREYIRNRSSSRFPNPRVDNVTMFPDMLPRLDEMKSLLIDEALHRTDNGHSRAAEMLGVSRQVVWRHMKRKSA
jgi:DNA-binding NtrC family response regulator